MQRQISHRGIVRRRNRRHRLFPILSTFLLHWPSSLLQLCVVGLSVQLSLHGRFGFFRFFAPENLGEFHPVTNFCRCSRRREKTENSPPLINLVQNLTIKRHVRSMFYQIKNIRFPYFSEGPGVPFKDSPLESACKAEIG